MSATRAAYPESRVSSARGKHHGHRLRKKTGKVPRKKARGGAVKRPLRKEEQTGLNARDRPIGGLGCLAPLRLVMPDYATRPLHGKG